MISMQYDKYGKAASISICKIILTNWNCKPSLKVSNHFIALKFYGIANIDSSSNLSIFNPGIPFQ